MALTNRERQARYRARLKAQASASCASALRDRTRQIVTDEWVFDGCDDPESIEAATAARDHVLSLPDASLVALWDQLIEKTYAAEFLRVVQIARRRSKRRPLVTKSGGAAV